MSDPEPDSSKGYRENGPGTGSSGIHQSGANHRGSAGEAGNDEPQGERKPFGEGETGEDIRPDDEWRPREGERIPRGRDSLRDFLSGIFPDADGSERSTGDRSTLSLGSGSRPQVPLTPSETPGTLPETGSPPPIDTLAEQGSRGRHPDILDPDPGDAEGETEGETPDDSQDHGQELKGDPFWAPQPEDAPPVTRTQGEAPWHDNIPDPGTGSVEMTGARIGDPDGGDGRSLTGGVPDHDSEAFLNGDIPDTDGEGYPGPGTGEEDPTILEGADPVSMGARAPDIGDGVHGEPHLSHDPSPEDGGGHEPYGEGQTNDGLFPAEEGADDMVGTDGGPEIPSPPDNGERETPETAEGTKAGSRSDGEAGETPEHDNGADARSGTGGDDGIHAAWGGDATQPEEDRTEDQTGLNDQGPYRDMHGEGFGSDTDTGLSAKSEGPEKGRWPELDRALQRGIGTGGRERGGIRARMGQNMVLVRELVRTQLRAYYGELTGRITAEHPLHERRIFNPIMIGMQESIMLFSGLMLVSLLLLFFFFEDVWYDNFHAMNAIMLVIFGGIMASGFLLFFFSESDTPRLKGSLRKKVLCSITGLILLVAAVLLMALHPGADDGWGGIISGTMAAVGLFSIIISSQSMSREEAYRFTIFFAGTMLLVLIPIHESMGVHPSGFDKLPLAPLNFALLVSGASLTMLGIHLLRERSGYFGVWLVGILIFSIIPVHEFRPLGMPRSESYEMFDQAIALIGSFLLLSGYMMFFYRFRRYMAMSEAVYLGNLFFEQGRLAKAERQYRKAFWILDRMGNLHDYDVIWGNMGNIHARKRSAGAAFACFEMGITINPENDILWNDKGNLFYTLGNHRGAIRAYRRGIELNERNTVLHQNLGVALSAVGHHEEAIKSYDRAITLNPKYERAWHNKGKSYHDLGDFEGALTAYDAALRINQESRAWLDRGDVLYLLERYEEALKSYDRAVRTHADDPEIRIRRGVCHYSLHMYETAIDDFRRAVELDATLAVPYNLLGNTHAQLGDLHRAKEHYTMAIERRGTYSRARFNLARTMARIGENALEAYDSAVHVTDRQRLNEVWFDEAIQYYNETIHRLPGNARAWVGRANLLLKIGKVGSAISSYEKVIDLEPGNARIHNQLGIALKRIQQLEGALESFTQATRIDPSYCEAWNNKGNVLYLMGHFHEALQAYNRALDLEPGYRSAIHNRHRCINQLKSDVLVESVPLKSSVEDYMRVIDTYREEGFKVDILENLLQEGKPHIIHSGFEDYKRRVGRLKIIAGELDELDIDPELKARIRKVLNDPELLDVILEVVDDAKRKRTRDVFMKLQQLGSMRSSAKDWDPDEHGEHGEEDLTDPPDLSDTDDLF